jgi:hypothetical protein
MMNNAMGKNTRFWFRSRNNERLKNLSGPKQGSVTGWPRHNDELRVPEDFHSSWLCEQLLAFEGWLYWVEQSEIFLHLVFRWPLLWSSGQISRLQMQRSQVRFPALPHLWEVVGLERRPVSLVSTIEELLGRNSSCSGLKSREYSCGDPFCWPCNILNAQKLALTWPTSGSRSVDIVDSWAC